MNALVCAMKSLVQCIPQPALPTHNPHMNNEQIRDRISERWMTLTLFEA